MNAPLFPVHTGVAAYEKEQASAAAIVRRSEIDPADCYDGPSPYLESVIEKDLANQVLKHLRSGRWDGVHVDAYGMANHKPVKTSQEMVDVVLEQIFHHDGARAYLVEWLASPDGLGAACARCIADGHAGTNANGLMQAHVSKLGYPVQGD